MSYPNVLLISEGKLKNFTSINKNVDVNLLRSEVYHSQEIDLQTLLGTKFYTTLLSRVSATGNTFTVDEKYFVDNYISDYLIQSAFYNALPSIHLKVKNVGVVEGISDNGSAVDLTTLQYLRNIQKQRRDFYAQRILDYLNIGDGVGKFPEYINYNSKDGMYPDKNQAYNQGIFLNKVTRKGYAYKNLMKQVPVYSESRMANPDCPECWQ